MNTEARPRTEDQPSARRAARLAAVQALYQLEISGEKPDAAVLGEFPGRFAVETLDGGENPSFDRDFFADIVKGVVERKGEIDQLIAGALARDLTVERLELLLRVILRAGTFEILARLDVPARVALAEHVGISHAFFAERETGLVNGVLDKLARSLRAGEMQVDAKTSR